MMEIFSQPQFFIKAFVIVCGVAWIIALHRGQNSVNLAELFMEGGKLSARKFYESGAFFVTSVWVLVQILVDKATLSDVLAYAGLWVIARAAGQQINKGASDAKSTSN